MVSFGRPNSQAQFCEANLNQLYEDIFRSSILVRLFWEVSFVLFVLGGQSWDI